MDGRLNCEELEIRLNELLDRRRAPADDPQIQQHIELCVPCFELVKGHDLVQKCLDDSVSSIDELDVDVSNSVVNNWAHLFPEPKTRAWRISTLAIVVCLLILLPIGLIWIPWPGSEPQPDAAPLSTNNGTGTNLDANPDSQSAIANQQQEPAISIEQLMGQADDQLSMLSTYRPTMQLLGVSTMVESIDLTLNYLMNRMPPDKSDKKPPQQNDKADKADNEVKDKSGDD